MWEGEGNNDGLPYACACLVEPQNFVAGLDGIEVEEFEVESGDVEGEGVESTTESVKSSSIVKWRSAF